jgi:hypothetical protein
MYDYETHMHDEYDRYLWECFMNEATARMVDKGDDVAGNAAAWWAQEVIGARASGDVRAVALAVMRGIDDGDQLVLNGLPDWPTDTNVADEYAAVWRDGWPEWEDLTTKDQDQLVDALREGFHNGIADAVHNECYIVTRNSNSNKEI